jgi:hypothetical protein
MIGFFIEQTLIKIRSCVSLGNFRQKLPTKNRIAFDFVILLTQQGDNLQAFHVGDRLFSQSQFRQTLVERFFHGRQSNSRRL